MRTSYVTRYSPARESEHGDTWREAAACRNADPDLFVVHRANQAQRRTDAAKALCAVCPVVAACDAWATRVGERHLVAGGKTPAERRTT